MEENSLANAYITMYSVDGSFKQIYYGLALVEMEKSFDFKNYLAAGIIGWSVHVIYDTSLSSTRKSVL